MFGLFAGKDRITAPQVASELGLSERMARNLFKGFVDDGWLEVADLTQAGAGLFVIGNLSAIHWKFIGIDSEKQ